MEEELQKVNLSSSVQVPENKTFRQNKKSTSLTYWESLSTADFEEQFNYWNRRQTTGLTIEQLSPRISIYDNDNMLLIVIDLSIDRKKINLMKPGKKRKNLEKLLKTLL